MSYKQKTDFAHERIPKNRHNSGSRPSPGMIPGAKLIILARLKFTYPPKYPGTSKMTLEQIQNVKIRQNLGEGGPLLIILKVAGGCGLCFWSF